MPVIHIQLLGSFALREDTAPVAGIDSARLQSLVTLLLLRRHSSQPRQHLAFLLWPDSSDKQAQANLRNLLHRLVQAWPASRDFLEIAPKWVQWRPGSPFTLDLAEFERHLEQARSASETPLIRCHLEAAVELYQGDLLPACYEEWIVGERARLRQAYLHALDQCVDILEDLREYEQAIRLAQQSLREEPLMEENCRRLMRLNALNGNRSGALSFYHHFAAELNSELGVAPGPATREVYERLLQMEDDEPLIAGPALAAASPLVGRQSEWERLVSTWRKLVAGSLPSQFILLSGEAGIGKTHLATEFLDWAARQGVTMASAQCYASEGTLPFSPLTQWLRSMPLTDLEGLWLSEIARLLPELLAQNPRLLPPGPASEPWQRQRMFESLARAVLAQKQPVLLFLDDLHWCDQDTLEWLHFLFRYDPLARILVLGSHQEGEAASYLEVLTLSLQRSSRWQEIHLERLDEKETALLAAHLEGHPIEPSRSAALFAETEGVPLFLVETIRAETPGAETSRTARTAHSPLELNRSGLPPAVQTVLVRRLGQLSPTAMEIAGTAAAIGRVFDLDVLAGAISLPEDALMRGLDELWQRRIVRCQSPGCYDFSHEKLREVAYAMLLPARRTFLHRRAAQALERVKASCLSEVSGQIAAHYRLGGMPERASKYYQLAASSAPHLSANQEAIEKLNAFETLHSLK